MSNEDTNKVTRKAGRPKKETVVVVDSDKSKSNSEEGVTMETKANPELAQALSGAQQQMDAEKSEPTVADAGVTEAVAETVVVPPPPQLAETQARIVELLERQAHHFHKSKIDPAIPPRYTTHNDVNLSDIIEVLKGSVIGDDLTVLVLNHVDGESPSLLVPLAVCTQISVGTHTLVLGSAAELNYSLNALHLRNSENWYAVSPRIVVNNTAMLSFELIENYVFEYISALVKVDSTTSGFDSIMVKINAYCEARSRRPQAYDKNVWVDYIRYMNANTNLKRYVLGTITEYMSKFITLTSDSINVKILEDMPQYVFWTHVPKEVKYVNDNPERALEGAPRYHSRDHAKYDRSRSRNVDRSELIGAIDRIITGFDVTEVEQLLKYAQALDIRSNNSGSDFIPNRWAYRSDDETALYRSAVKILAELGLRGNSIELALLIIESIKLYPNVVDIDSMKLINDILQSIFSLDDKHRDDLLPQIGRAVNDYVTNIPLNRTPNRRSQRR